MPQLRDAAGLYSATDQLEDYIFQNSDVERPVEGYATAPPEEYAGGTQNTLPSEPYQAQPPPQQGYATEPLGGNDQYYTPTHAGGYAPGAGPNFIATDPSQYTAEPFQAAAPTTRPAPSTSPFDVFQPALNAGRRAVDFITQPSGSALAQDDNELTNIPGGGGGGGGGIGAPGSPAPGGGVYGPNGVVFRGSGTTARGGRVTLPPGIIARGARPGDSIQPNVRYPGARTGYIPKGGEGGVVGDVARTLPSSAAPIGRGSAAQQSPKTIAYPETSTINSPAGNISTRGTMRAGNPRLPIVETPRRFVGTSPSATRTIQAPRVFPRTPLQAPSTKLSPTAQNALNQAAANTSLTAAQRAQQANTARVQQAFRPAPATAPRRGISTRRALATTLAGAAGIGLGVNAADQQVNKPTAPDRAMPASRSAWGIPQEPSDFERSLAQPAARDLGTMDSANEPGGLVMQPDGTVSAVEREALMRRIGTSPSTQPTLSVFQLDGDGNVLLTDPAVVPRDSLGAALERGERPWQLDDTEFDALLAAGLIPEEDAEVWRENVVGKPVMAPQEWVTALGGSDVTYEPVESTESAAADTVAAGDTGGGGSSWSSGGRGSSRGGGSYGGGGYGGGGGSYPGTMPMSMNGGDEAWMGRPDPWANPIFDRYFQTRDGGWPPQPRSGRRSGMRRRRGMPSMNRRSRGGARSMPGMSMPSGGMSSSDAALAAALALRNR